MTQVIISDYIVQRRMVLILDADDFAAHAKRWHQTDALLSAFKDHPFFGGCEQWSDLKVTHFHALIINMLKIWSSQPDMDEVKPSHATVQRLNFLICSLINLLQQSTGSIIDLLRINRVGRDDVLYDYCARLDVVFSPPKTGLRVVIDNA
jgi:hypothetical protein